MPFSRPTLTEIVARVQTDIETRVTGGESLLRRSVLKVLARVLAGAIHLLYSYLGFQAEQLFASTADVEGLEKIADEYGINRGDAVSAIGIASATGTNGTTIPVDTELQSSDGQLYTVDTEIDIGVGGTAELDLTAAEGGDDGNQDSGTILSFVSPISGVGSEATVNSDGLAGGVDEETDDRLRARVLRRRQFPPYGGAEIDYINWMLEYPGVTRAWTTLKYQGPGTVGCYFVMDDAVSYIPSDAILTLVRAYLVEHSDPATGRIVGIPVTAEPGLFVLALTEQVMNFNVGVFPNTTAIQIAIDAELTDLILQKGGPGETIYVSDIQSALSTVPDLERFNIVSPGSDTLAVSGKIHALGTTTYVDY